MEIYGDTAVIGALRNDDNGNDSGSTYVYVRNDDEWTLHAKLLAPATGEWFGQSVGVYNGIIISGSHSEVYVFSG